MVTPEENAWLKAFFNSVADRPLEPDDPKYICLYDDRELADNDPVAALPSTKSTSSQTSPASSTRTSCSVTGTAKSGTTFTPSCGTRCASRSKR